MIIDYINNINMLYLTGLDINKRYIVKETFSPMIRSFNGKIISYNSSIAESSGKVNHLWQSEGNNRKEIEQFLLRNAKLEEYGHNQ